MLKIFGGKALEVIILILNLLEPKVINLRNQYRARPASACTSVQSDQTLYCWLTNFKF